MADRQGYCATHFPAYIARRRDRSRLYDTQRGSARARGYDATWEKARRLHLARFPLCLHCHKRGDLMVGELVDHIVPVDVAPDRRLDPSNMQTLCRSCHAVKTAADARRYGSGEGV